MSSVSAPHEVGPAHAQDDPAIARMRRDLAAAPNPENSIPALARALIARKRLDEAHDLLNDVLVRCPGHRASLHVFTELALCLRDAGRTGQAETMFRRILQADASQVEANLALAWIMQARGEQAACTARFTAAIEALHQQIARDPANRQARLQLATALRGCGRLAEAEEVLGTILAGDPAHAAAHAGLGWIAHARQNHPCVITHFRAAFGLGAREPHAEMALAASLVQRHEVEEAEAIYRDLAARRPDWPAIHLALAGIARGRRDFPSARNHLLAGLALDRENLALAAKLAEIHCDLEEWQEAQDLYRSILARAPQDIEAWLGLAGVAKARGDMVEAAQVLAQAQAAAPLDLRIKKAHRAIEVLRNACDWKQEIADALAVAKSPGADMQTQLAAATILVEFGLTGMAAPLLDTILARNDLVPPVRLAAGQLGLAARQIERMGLGITTPPEGDHADPQASQLDAMRGITEKLVPGSDTLLVVFGGTNNRLWMTFSLLHRLLQPCGVSVVYARDLRQDWYASGVEGLGEDFASSAASLRALAQRAGARRILTIGNCIGCRGAIQFALALQAQGVLGLAPKIRPGNDMTLDQKGKLRAARTHMPHTLLNLKKALLGASNPPPVSLIYGELCEGDAADAHFLGEAPGVTLVPIPASHDTDSVKDLLVRGLLAPVLHAFVAAGTLPQDLRARIAASATG